MTERSSKAPLKRFDETVIFIHHFGGSFASTKRQQKLVNELGFDCYAFNLSRNVLPNWRGWLPRGLNFGMKNPVEVWREELEAVLDQLPGPKIIYSFSFPSAAVAFCLATRKAQDVRAWICDGGPFLHLLRCQYNLFTYAEPTPRGIRRSLLSVLAYFVMGGPWYARRVRRWMKQLPAMLEVLSFRAGRDLLVPPEAIAAFFGERAGVEVVSLPEAGHLEGLKNFPDIYTARLRAFCARITNHGQN